MTDSIKKIFKVPSRLCKRVAFKGYVLTDYVQAWLSYLFGPHGCRSSPKKRLHELFPTSASDGETPKKIAIFVAYARQLNHSTRAYLQALKDSGFSTIYINNATTSREDIPLLSSLTWRAFDRHNLGRDFGAFKDGILLLLQEGHLERCRTLCIANDSMQFIPGKNAESLVSALKSFDHSSKLALFSHISHQIQTHYQSYFQVLKREVFLSKAFLDFWKTYIPLSHRGYCIYQGEISLSQKVYRRFHLIDTLYTSDHLQDALETSFSEEGGVPADEVLRLMPSPARTSQRRKVGYSLNQLLIRSAAKERLDGSHLYNLSELIENGNPSHIAAFLYPFYLHCPFIKHDLCTAGSYTIAQAVSLFKEVLQQSIRPDDALEVKDFVDEFRDLMYERGVPLSYDNRLREAAVKGISGAFIYPSTYEY